MKGLLLFLTIISFTTFSQTGDGVYIKEKVVKCKVTLLRNTKDTLHFSFNDSCNFVIFDTLFNGVYVFLRTPSNHIARIVSFKNKKFDGQQIEYYRNGNIWTQGYNNKFKRYGKWTEYYMTGEIGTISYYKKGKVKSTKYFDKTGKSINAIEYFENKHK